MHYVSPQGRRELFVEGGEAIVGCPKFWHRREYIYGRNLPFSGQYPSTQNKAGSGVCIVPRGTFLQPAGAGGSVSRLNKGRTVLEKDGVGTQMPPGGLAKRTPQIKSQTGCSCWRNFQGLLLLNMRRSSLRPLWDSGRVPPLTGQPSRSVGSATLRTGYRRHLGSCSSIFKKSLCPGLSNTEQKFAVMTSKSLEWVNGVMMVP